MVRSDDVFEALGRLEGILRDRWPDMFDHLRPGATEADLDQFESELGQRLPDDFRTLYRWHDGADQMGRSSLPGIGHWRPLFTLPENCGDWYQAEHVGFEAGWIPFTSEYASHQVFLIDATGPQQSAAPVLHFELPDGVRARCASVATVVEQMIEVAGSEAIGVAELYEHRLMEPVVPVRNRFEEVPLAEPQGGPPGRPALQGRFGLRQRFDHDIDTSSSIDLMYRQMVVELVRLAELADEMLGRDLLAFRPDLTASVDEARQGVDQPDYRRTDIAMSLRRVLDLLWRAFERSGATPGAWQPHWRTVEGLAVSLQHRR